MSEHLLDRERRRAHKNRNLLHSIVLIGGLGLLMAVCAWIIWGLQGVLWAAIAAVATFLFAPRVSPQIVMKLFNAKPVRGGEAEPLLEIIRELTRRAQLSAMPKLYLIRSTTLNAFAVGTPDDASIAVTTGLLERLSLREVAAVLAHEVSHIRNNDLWIMGLADTLSRLTQMMAYFGVFLLALNLPMLMTGTLIVPWPVIALLYFAPTLGSLLQLALSRAREYDADLEGALLLGDPPALASALEKLERYQGRFWEDMLFPGGRKIPAPSILRSHPPTEERIRRLLELDQSATEPLRVPSGGYGPWGGSAGVPRDAWSAGAMAGFAQAANRPRYHWPIGMWF